MTASLLFACLGVATFVLTAPLFCAGSRPSTPVATSTLVAMRQRGGQGASAGRNRLQRASIPQNRSAA